MLKFRKTALIREEKPIKETIEKLKKVGKREIVTKRWHYFASIIFAEFDMEQTSLLKL